MFSVFKGKMYQPLREQELHDDEDDAEIQVLKPQNSKFERFSIHSVQVLLAISILANGFLLHSKLYPLADVCKSEYAQISWDIPRILSVPEFKNSIPDEEWDAIPASPGTITLTDEYAATKHLPYTQRWPWDETKGIYILQGHHNLHCIKAIRQSIFEYRHRLLQSQHYVHIDHCLVNLREDVICNADDTPRITSGNSSEIGTGLRQSRLCKDWKKLDQWAEKHTACYQDRKSRDQDMLELYMHCPDGSKPWEGIV